MELIDRNQLREKLMHEQAKYIMTDHMQSKHISGGFLLAIAELDGMPNVEAIPVEDLQRLWEEHRTRYGHNAEDIGLLISQWRKENRNG